MLGDALEFEQDEAPTALLLLLLPHTLSALRPGGGRARACQRSPQRTTRLSIGAACPLGAWSAGTSPGCALVTHRCWGWWQAPRHRHWWCPRRGRNSPRHRRRRSTQVQQLVRIVAARRMRGPPRLLPSRPLLHFTSDEIDKMLAG